MRSKWVIVALAAPIAMLGTAASGDAGGSDDFAQRLLAEQNSERVRVGVPQLQWSGRLTQQAQAWADQLAREGDLRHAPREVTGGAGENLWMGSAGYYGAEAMIGTFVGEKQLYRHGAFPAVSASGRWEDVGHYTQIVWRDTREVGCALARGRQYDVLVCRYWPAGNWMGQVAF